MKTQNRVYLYQIQKEGFSYSYFFLIPLCCLENSCVYELFLLRMCYYFKKIK